MNVSQGGEDINSSSTLIYRMKAMDQEAWRRFVHIYGPLVYKWCRNAGLSEDEAADIGQNVFQAVVRKIGDFSHKDSGSTLQGWLRVVTRNKIVDHARAKKAGDKGIGGSDAMNRLAEIPAPNVDSHTAVASDPEDEMILIRRALELVLSDFNEESRRAYLMLVVENRKPAEVASELGLTLNAVYLIKSRITRRLREEFAGVIDFDQPSPSGHED